MSARLTDEDVDRIAQRVGGGHVTVKGGDGGFRKLIDGLLLIGVAALIGVVWDMSKTVSALTTQVTYLSQEVTSLRARQP